MAALHSSRASLVPTSQGRTTSHAVARVATHATASTSGSTESLRRGVLILPGLGNNAKDYSSLSTLLTKRGCCVRTAKVTRPDWSRNAAALTDINWWLGSLKPRPAVDWYLKLVNEAMQELKAAVGDDTPITVLTHSAGGWLGRVYLLDFGTTGVDSFVSLGSPHQAPPAGVVDQTRGILTWINDKTPGAFHSQIKYTTVAGKFVKGVDPLSSDGDFLARFAGAGYQQVCGTAEADGDFIVPVAAAHLPGANQLTLEQCFHSPLGEKLPFFGPWYGSEQMLDKWVHALDGAESAATAQAPVSEAAPAAEVAVAEAAVAEVVQVQA